MTLKLPENYLANMQRLLGPEYESFLDSYMEPPNRGLRFNLTKVRKETIQKLKSAWNLEPVTWCPTGYYYQDVRPGLSPYHDSGVFYIQEPSAMIAVEEAKIGPQETVLDLCAAPGGKSGAAAERCRLLVSNEIHPQRARILSSNMERLGFRNILVCSSDPSRLAEIFPEEFDTVLCDAPCSGEGMMRKDDTAISEWSLENVSLCIARQSEILACAALMVKPGGKLVYSTCTFERGENEEQTRLFLKGHSEFQLLSEKRIWPHHEKGEGHFCAVFQKKAASFHSRYSEKQLQQYKKELVSAGIHVLRCGIEPGKSFKDKRGNIIYEPSHAEIMSSLFETCTAGIDLKEPEEAFRYLRGEVLRIDELKAVRIRGGDGFCGVYFDGYPLGLGKKCQNTVKNHLPKGLRRLN